MKLVTTFAALELLGRDYRWTTEAYLDGPLDDGDAARQPDSQGARRPEDHRRAMAVVHGDACARRASTPSTATSSLDRSFFALPPHDPAAFDGEPLKPYNVGPDALLVNFKSMRFGVRAECRGRRVDVQSRFRRSPTSTSGRRRGSPPATAAIGATPRASRRSRIAATAAASFRRTLSASTCGERDWWVSLLDHPAYVYAMFDAYFREAGGRFAGGWRSGRAPPGDDAVRDPRIAAALRRRPRRQQALEQRDGAAGVPDARHDGARRRRRRPAGASAAVRRWLATREAQDARARARKRLRAFAQRADQRGQPRPAADRRRREPRARGVRELARGGRRWTAPSSGASRTSTSPARRC